MTEMEQDIYNRACIHYKNKYHMEKIMENYDFDIEDRSTVIEDRSTVIGEFWTDYFSGNPIYIEGSHAYEQRRLLGLHG